MGLINYMAHPSEVFREARLVYGSPVSTTLKGREGEYAAGRMSVALELVGLLKTLDMLPLTGSADRVVASSTVETLLIDLGLRDAAWELYDELCSWRRVDIRPEGAVHRQGTTSSGRVLVVGGDIPVRVHSDMPPGKAYLVDREEYDSGWTRTDGSPALLPSPNDGVDARGPVSESIGSFSLREAPGNALLQRGRAGAVPEEHRNRDALPISSQGEPSS